ncbi:MAG: sigma-70 family RNA polymerase sigma factor [Thermostichales cyanobacterium BF4_bins_65]
MVATQPPSSTQLGDPHGFRQLYQCHQQRVRAILSPLCSPDVLDDLVQETFVRAWKGLPRFRQQAEVSTWLYRIAWNVGMDHQRRRGRQRRHQQTLIQTTPSEHRDPGLLQLHYQTLVQQGLASLSPQHRVVLVLHDLEEWCQKDIATSLGIPVGTVKSRLFYARAQLRRFLEQAGIQP